MRRRMLRLAILTALAAVLLVPASAAAASGTLSRDNNTPFPSSRQITNATWTTARYGPPSNQFGDILSASSLQSSSLYLMMDDGGTDTGGTDPATSPLWRNSLARVTGSPPNLRLTGVGNAGPAKTYSQVDGVEDNLTGLLGSFYSTGFTVAGGVFYATQVTDWNWNANSPFNGLAGIAYSTDQGRTWRSTGGAFPAAAGNLNFVQFGANATASDGYVYAIATEREFNASSLILGRVRPGPANVTDPSRWQWAAGGSQWTQSISAARPILSWKGHITYPRISYDAPLHRYLLTFTYSYSNTVPGVWQDGSELVILEAPSLRGPFSFVARQPNLGPSNGYDPAFPVNWISSDGKQLWMIWAANFDGCSPGLDCSGAYGLNLRKLALTVSGGSSSSGPNVAELSAAALTRISAGSLARALSA